MSPLKLPSFDFLSNGCGLFLAAMEAGGDFGRVPEVVRDHRVDVRQRYGGVLLCDLQPKLWGEAIGPPSPRLRRAAFACIARNRG